MTHIELVIDNGVGRVTGLMSTSVSLAQTTTFTLTATNADGATSAQVVVDVSVPTAAPTITTFSASPNQFSLEGGQTTLQWAVVGAVTLSIDQGIGDVTGLTSVEDTITSTKTYTLSATNAIGSSTASVTASVYVPTSPPVINSFDATPASLPSGGGTVILSWNTRGAQTIFLNGVRQFGNSTSVFVSMNTPFTLTTTNSQGQTSSSLTVTVGP